MSSFDGRRTAADLVEARDLMAEMKLFSTDASTNHFHTLVVALLIKLERVAQAISSLSTR